MVKKDEIKGYHEFAKLNWGEQEFDISVDRGRKSEYFNYLVGLMDGGGKLLDLGAGICWTSQILTERGYDVTALEMNGSPICGVGVVINRDKEFEVVMGDCEAAPIKDGSFDIVFCHQVLHHADDLDKMVSEMVRCVRKGGLIVVGGEHIRPWFTSDESFRGKHPAVKFGANEHAYSYRRYRDAFKRAGMDVKVVPRGRECGFKTIRWGLIRWIVRGMDGMGMVRLVDWVLLNFSGAGTEVTIYSN